MTHSLLQVSVCGGSLAQRNVYEACVLRWRPKSVGLALMLATCEQAAPLSWYTLVIGLTLCARYPRNQRACRDALCG